MKTAFLGLFALCTIAGAYGQGRSGQSNGNGPGGNGNGNGPKGGNSNGGNPHATAIIRSSENSTTTMLTPTAWGSTESFGFLTVGGTPRQRYGTKADMAIRGGVGFGDARKFLSVVGFVNVYDVSEVSKLRFRDVTYSFIVSRSLGKLGSVSVGSIDGFADTSVTDGVHSFYVAYSWAARGLRSVTPGNPRLSFTVGAGNGKYYLKSEADILAGRGKYGTALFANVSYDVIKNLSVNAEWTGLNLGLTTAYRLPHNIATVYAGVAELTGYSADRPMFVFGLGRTFGLHR